MARITKDSSVLNQFGSPSLNSNSFANRPAFGQAGRLFIDTTNNIIQRDTGTSWVTISGGAGSTPNLEQVTTVGKRSTIGIFLGPDAITPSDRIFDVYGTTLLHNLTNGAADLPPLQYNQNAINYIGGTVSGFCNSLFAQDVYNISASTSISASTQTGTTLSINTYKFTSASTLTLTQLGGIRTASALTVYSQFLNSAAGTITHTAGIAILGIEGLGGSGLTINNHYQLLINSSTEFANAPTIPANNRWGIYQAGSSDNNYFAGKVFINATTPISDELFRVNGIARITNVVSTDTMYGLNGFNLIGGNAIIGNGTNDGNLLQVYGSSNFIKTTNGSTSIFVTNTANTPLMAFNANGGLTCGTIGLTGGNIEQFNIENLRNNGFFNFKINSTIVTQITSTALLINTTSNTNSVTLKVNGEQEWSNITFGTGTHTTSGNHLPIWVNGTKYWLALLNPVLP